MSVQNQVGRPVLKICCIADVAEARLAMAHGAQALGLVSAMPSGPGVIDEAVIAEVAAVVAAEAPAVHSFLLTSQPSAAAIVAQARRCRPSTLQIVDTLPGDELARLRDALPDLQLVQVVHVTGEHSLDESLALAPWVDAILLDSGNPALAVKQLGGTGRTHNWAISQRIRQALAERGTPMWLAGGLHAGNAAQAVAQVQPFGLDVCSGVRTAGRLDAGRLAALVAAVAGGGGGG